MVEQDSSQINRVFVFNKISLWSGRGSKILELKNFEEVYGFKFNLHIYFYCNSPVLLEQDERMLIPVKLHAKKNC